MCLHALGLSDSALSSKGKPDRRYNLIAMQSTASSPRACSGFHASSSTREGSISRKAGAVVPRARALATPPSQEPQSSRRRMSQNAVALEREVLSCPWPRKTQASRAVPEGRGLLSSTVSALQQVRRGPYLLEHA
jgi:hypothetical protein